MPTGRNELKIALILAIFFLLGISLILLINPSSPPPPVRNNQKTICASFGIQLPNYAEYPVNASDAADWMFVEYNGSSLECDSSTSVLQNFTAQCKIGDPEGGLIALQVNGTHCRFIEKKS